MQKFNCLIMGCGRSGTSMCAGLLAKYYYMGPNLLPPTIYNSKGFFESERINNINHNLLLKVEEKISHKWLVAAPLDVELNVHAELVDRMRSMMIIRPFCFKDPRFCYTLPAWRNLLPERTKFICTFRDPSLTIASMLRYHNHKYPHATNLELTKERAFKTWISMYTHVLEKHRKEGDWLFVSFDQIISGQASKRINSFLLADVDNGFPDDKLNNSREGPKPPKEAMKIYNILCRISETKK